MVETNEATACPSGGAALAARLILGGKFLDGVAANALGLVNWAVPRVELAQRAAEIVRGTASLRAAALAASKACIAVAGHSDRGGYTDELELARLLLNNAETRQRVEAFLAGSTGSSMQTKKGAAR
jgi:enoyl-CoA hydratase/carnithine racemase